MTSASAPQPWTWREYLLAFVLWDFTLLITLAPLMAVPWIFTNDGPEHLYGAWLPLHLPELRPEDQAMVALHPPLTSNTVRLLFAPLDALMGWRAAWTGVHALLLVAMHTAISLVFVFRRPGAIWALGATPPLVWSWLFCFGLFNYYGALAVGLGIVLVGIASPDWRGLRGVMIAALLTLCGVLHMFAADLAGLGLFCVTLARIAQKPGEWLTRMVQVIGVGLPLIGFTVLISTLYGVDPEGLDAAFERWAGPTWREGFAQIGVPGPTWRTWPLVGVAAGALAWGAIRFRDLRNDEHRLTWWLFGLICGVAWVITPFAFQTWQAFSPRFAPVALVAALASLPAFRLRTQLVLAAAVGFWGAGAGFWMVNHQRALNERCADLVAALDASPSSYGMQAFVPLGSCLDPTSYDDTPDVPRVSSVLHFGGALAVAQKTLYQGFHGIPALHTHTILWMSPLLGPRADELLWNSVGVHVIAAHAQGVDATTLAGPMTLIAEQAASVDRTWIRGPEPLLALWEQAGFVTEFAEGPLRFTRFDGCPTTVTLSRPDETPMALEYGWIPLGPEAWFGRVLMPGRVPSAALALDRPTCGPMWLHVRAGAQGEQRLACAEATANGLLIIPPAAPGQTRALPCTIGR